MEACLFVGARILYLKTLNVSTIKFLKSWKPQPDLSTSLVFPRDQQSVTTITAQAAFWNKSFKLQIVSRNIPGISQLHKAAVPVLRREAVVLLERELAAEQSPAE